MSSKKPVAKPAAEPMAKSHRRAGGGGADPCTSPSVLRLETIHSEGNKEGNSLGRVDLLEREAKNAGSHFGDSLKR